MANLFEILKKINIDDEANKSRNLAMGNTLLSLNRVSGGFEVKMGVSYQAGMDLFTEKSMAIILVLDKQEYKKVKSQLEGEVVNG